MIFSCLPKVIEFLEYLIKYRFYRSTNRSQYTCNTGTILDESTKISYQYEQLAETIFYIILKNEKRYSDIEIPTKLVARFLGRIECTNLPGVREKMTLLYLDWFGKSANTDYDFDDANSSTKFFVQMILPRTKQDIATILESYAIWCRETKKDKETKIYCAAFLANRMCKKYGESLKGMF